MIDLSVLVCSTHTRYKTFGRSIQDQLWGQLADLPEADQPRVEIIMVTDNKQMMLGQKRNVMVDMAQGRYVVFVDDDDTLERNYLLKLLQATQSDADVITFLVSVTLDGGKPKICLYSKGFPADRNTPEQYERLPNHICAVKRDIANQVSFPNIAYGEDSAYSKLLKPLLHTEHHIPEVLYHYRYNSQTTETQQHRNAALRQRNRPPVADVIFLSKATDAGLQAMTQGAIDSCISGANSLPINVIVVEQNPDVEYKRAVTLPLWSAPFNYNEFANMAAKLGRAPWIVVANNDVQFHDGWLHHLLAANHPIVSPKCPGDSRQWSIKTNTTGTRTGVHLSGWCFMIDRRLWARIGGFDEDFPFWCADDAVIEQVKALGIEPMLVPDSRVEHLTSVTLNGEPAEVQDDLTWGGIHTFIRKYGSHRLGTHPGYIKWKASHARRT